MIDPKNVISDKHSIKRQDRTTIHSLVLDIEAISVHLHTSPQIGVRRATEHFQSDRSHSTRRVVLKLRPSSGTPLELRVEGDCCLQRCSVVENSNPVANTKTMKDRDLSPMIAPGQEIGGCRIIRSIGAGGMGQVFLAQHVALKKQVAVKILSPDRAGQREVSRFIREARACSRIDHPNVVTVHDVGQQDGLFYIIMQYVKGRNLAELVRLNGGGLDWRTASLIIRQASKGLAAAHQHGIIHRDIKPGNIMLAEDGRVVLLDFGLVMNDSDSDRTRNANIVGTPAYMSPEQCTGKGLDSRSDIFSLGCTYYFLLSGTDPYSGTPVCVLNANGSGKRPKSINMLNPSIPIDIVQVVNRAMARDVRRRFPSAQSMASTLTQAVRCVSAPQPSLPETKVIEIGSEPIPDLMPPQGESLDSIGKYTNRTRLWVFGGIAVAVLTISCLCLNFAYSGLFGPVKATILSATATDKPRMAHLPARKVPIDQWLLRLHACIDQDPPIIFCTMTPVENVSVGMFSIDQREVASTRYDTFVEEKGWEPPSRWRKGEPLEGEAGHPVKRVRNRHVDLHGLAFRTHAELRKVKP